jgi:hypothetical protein
MKEAILTREDVYQVLDEISSKSEVHYRMGRQGIPMGDLHGWCEWKIVRGKRSWGMIYSNAQNNLLIEEYNWGGQSGCNATVFNARCRDKKELKVIFEQTGIYERGNNN